MPWIEVTMDGEEYQALTHALVKIGFKPSSGRPYKDEIDIVWRKANKELKQYGRCIVTRNGQGHSITLR